MKYACRLTALARYLRLCGEQAQGTVKAGGIGGSKQLLGIRPAARTAERCRQAQVEIELAVVRSDYA